MSAPLYGMRDNKKLKNYNTERVTGVESESVLG